MGFKARQPEPIYAVEPTTEFLNIDLELEGPVDIAPLIQALSPVYVLHSSSKAPFMANLEIEPGVGMDFHSTMLAFLTVIESLDHATRALWDQCTKKCFDIGLQSGLEPHCSQYSLSASHLQRLASIGAELVITVYGAQYEPTSLPSN